MGLIVTIVNVRSKFLVKVMRQRAASDGYINPRETGGEAQLPFGLH